ncbi:MAG: YbhB/YbcL family Raf kinase inhibitor-like protein [Hymenobacteraceae bacterium]|nr:YbhB/YbcL family Raf kinase inhibitor-like protein [Hymenobacteraceae bacterium]
MASEKNITVTSPAFEHQGNIPQRFTCDGEDVNPEIRISNLPENTKTLALIVDDPDAPAGTWVHWVVWNIKPSEKIAENSSPGQTGTNDFKKKSYGGPCPPPGKPHRYFFKVYALDAVLDLPAGSSKAELEKAMQNHVLAQSELVGLYQQK